MRDAVGSKLFWNASFRFLIEIYIQIAMMAMLNIVTIEWHAGLSSLSYNNLFAIMMVIVVWTFPIALILLYILKID